MKRRDWLTWGGIILGATGLGLAVRSFLPRKLTNPSLSSSYIKNIGNSYSHATATGGLVTSLPEIEVEVLRCGSIIIPECIAVRGTFSLAPRVIAHSAVLIRHPRGTFLYDTGLCSDIRLFLLDQSLYFNQTLGKFDLDMSIGEHLQHRKLQPADLDFVLLSHLHWDHVSGIPDLAGVKLRINRVEYEAGYQGLVEQRQGLVGRLLGSNPIELFDCDGAAYEGFPASHDLFGDGSIVLVPLPGHTAGQVGMLINRANGPRLFLIGDAAWVAENYLVPTTMHPFIWSQVTGDDVTACQTLVRLHHFARQHPDVTLIPMHDARVQEAL